ncbi:MAG: Coenzyme F420 hydrogenase/dehydrogenase, beta subunit C-terminal domain [Lachnospiraceae bacterium]|nr:Coenzyme F420 hydrogenase/dehydrogenase, beta subunit C-terminal domain [Lachnospiraceae bacterium]
MIYDVGDRCVGCGACASSCPHKAISLKEDKMGFRYPEIDDTLCMHCQLCRKICPILQRPALYENSMGYGLQCYDESVLNTSSSGGAFYLLASEILKRGGIVYGAAYSSDFTKVYHKAAYDFRELTGLCGSKYVQSDVGDTFGETRENLKAGKWVLYSGTPCQLAALDNYLGERVSREKLLSVDILCHGVCSPEMWGKYIEYRKKCDGGFVPLKVSMRDKTYGWRKFSLKIQYEDNSYVESVDQDLFLRGFLRHVYLRKSCYECNFKGLHRCAEITLGDFWDGGKVIRDMDDRGTSLVIVHSDKGEQFFQIISSRGKWTKIPDVKTVSNDGMYHNAWYNWNRKYIEKNIDRYSFEKLYRKYFSDSMPCKLGRYVCRAVASHKRGFS